MKIFGSILNNISRILNSVGAGILVVMMLLTTADVLLRYLFGGPITGAFELQELFMAMLVGFGLAFTGIKKGHVSVDLVIDRLPHKLQSVINAITCFLSFIIFLLISWRMIVYAEGSRAGTLATQSLHIPMFPFMYLVAFGGFLLALVFLYNALDYIIKVVRENRIAVWPILILVIAGVVFLFALPVWGQELIGKIDPLNAGLIGVGLLIILLFSGMPIGIVMAVVGFIGMAYVIGLKSGLSSLDTAPYNTVSSYALSVIPLFVLMGTFCYHSGLSRALYNTAYKWLGHLPGGLAMATVGACAGFAAVSGSSFATVATIGTVSLPEMRKYKYDDKLATGVIAAGGSIGILIPPSTILIIYGVIAEQSIGKLFLAGFIPGVLEAVFYMITIFILCKRNPALGPRGERATFTERVVSLKDSWGVLVLFILVIGGIYTGIFTATEAAGIGAFGAFLFALLKKQLTFKSFTDSLKETSKTTAMVLMILIGAAILGYFLAVSRLPFELSSWVAALPVNRYIILIIIVVFYIFIGAIMSALAMIVLTVPIIFPVIVALNFDPIWFGILIVRVVEMGQITPPVGLNVYILQGVAKDVPMFTIFRGIIPFLIADICHVALLIAVPQIATFLPNLMK